MASAFLQASAIVKAESDRLRQTLTSVINMQYLTTEQAALKFRTTPEYMRRLCREGRVKGAMQVGRAWIIPAGWVYVRQQAGRKGK